ncbi:uncharacterized protein LY89DRAFT_669779 [Mollisia scopiformis]|uniref:Uncharacterized protein n=1 Tax=Mollisia scopiformis TaxID=149040 RepID=A0A194X7V1_MOLSC|nr:uncharacterized protein LY89DRAFT_669779 [Mollisia scopiformis]KUJ16246.1 hypothetical protein LY89DRAFT_669779 [Mollisia scopiformis]
MEEVPKVPNLVATTGETYCTTIAKSRIRESIPHNGEGCDTGSETRDVFSEEDEELNYFKSAQWTSDGTSLLTSSADNTIRTFILPPDLLSEPSAPKSITPYSKHTYPTAINCLTPYPLYDLSDPSTTLYLSAPTSLPIRLTNALSPSPIAVSTYNLVSPTTETWQTPASILWSAPGHFLTGTDCLICVFDVSRNGEGPVTRLPTIPSKRHLMKGGGVGIRGIVSALSQQSAEGMIAAGTWTRSIGLYDAGGMGGTVSVWNIAEAADEIASIGGTGITQTVWSDCGRYLCVVERKSNGVLVYDVRVTGKLVSWLEGRGAYTNQRLGVDVFATEKGMEVWGGGADGVVGVWEGVGVVEGSQERAWEWRAHDGSTAMHPSGSVVATCSGQRGRLGLEDDSDDESSDDSHEDSDSSSESESDDASSPATSSPSSDVDNSLKIWSI